MEIKKIYIEIGNLRENFIDIAYNYDKDETTVNDAVQELMLYFLQMNPETLQNIFIKDGNTGLLKYGRIALKRFLTSERSIYSYKYKNYYKPLYNASITHYDKPNTKDITNQTDFECPNVYKHKKLDLIDKTLEEVYWYDREIFKLYYYESNTLDSLASKTKIGRNSLYNTINKVREFLKKKLNEDV